jgi:putative Ca2+/H+ antiporter (TMEM165/GDT1 family)
LLVAVFFGAALALILLFGVAVGTVLGNYLPEAVLRKVAAGAFILIGVLMLAEKM